MSFPAPNLTLGIIYIMKGKVAAEFDVGSVLNCSLCSKILYLLFMIYFIFMNNII